MGRKDDISAGLHYIEKKVGERGLVKAVKKSSVEWRWGKWKC